MKKLVFYINIMLLIPLVTLGQETNSNIIWIEPKSDKVMPNKIEGTPFAEEMKRHNAIIYQQALPFAKNPRLKNIYQIICTDSNDATNLSQILKSKYNNDFSTIRHLQEPISTYDPSDYMWSIIPSDTGSYLWHLKKIEAEKAWDITKGSQDIQVAVIDTWFDINHPDLQEKFTSLSDPMSNIQYSSNCFADHHGTAVSSCVAAHTDGGGQMSSIGFNTMIIPYHWGNGLAKALHASNVEGADIISISWFSSCSRDITGQDSLVIKEILDNGTIIVAAAGNGYLAARCPSSNFPPFSPIFPFSPTYDNRLICVSSTDRHDNHSFFVDGENNTHSHFPEVDVCAPGYRVMVAKSTLEEENGICVTNAWPYSGWGTGTSFATPIVAGVCALMKSVNPCLTPAQAKNIIKSTTDPIADAHLYPGMVGAGRVNAYNAVKAAGTRSLAYTTLSGNQSYGAGYALNVAYTNIGSNSNITLTARNEVNISMSFNMPLGSTLEITIDPDAVNTCN